MLASDDPVVVAAEAAIEAGDVEGLRALLAEHPGLAAERTGDADQSRTLLHAAVDWPGHKPRTVEVIRALLDAGAPVDGRFAGHHTETPLHWAASSDDVAALDALLDAGADIEATGAVIGGGTPLTDATAFGQWATARRLVERGAVSGRFEAAAMGQVDRLRALYPEPAPEQGALDGSLWGACHGGQLAAAQYLVERGADPGWLGWDDLTPLAAARRSAGEGVPGAADVVAWLESRQRP
jgi:hypothetical protein